MQHLNRGMLGRYDIPEHIPTDLTGVQFGLSEALLGAVDRLIDAANPALGLACVCPEAAFEGAAAPAALLRDQEGLFTLLVRGYRNETAVKEEVVRQVEEAAYQMVVD
ncbi:MAG: hypothetical protein IKN05_04475, partial [Clostridia bacterium]|nr:hypothetical protein [Clostridia bacterium]